ncbi:hypothetical protein GDO81_006426 [Engystomops pustulosus]|uniref:Uncharacterized protein n=1 Tax=Engystomops pustulosus TaxID=76066 RepID=A0AAV7CWI5_ENGPU|nr:hypothetical protein GDO81_006426 [Engystomops pustulosus]
MCFVPPTFQFFSITTILFNIHALKFHSFYFTEQDNQRLKAIVLVIYVNIPWIMRYFCTQCTCLLGFCFVLFFLCHNGYIMMIIK